MPHPQDDLPPIIAFDPGVTGAFAVLDHDGATTIDIPVMHKEIIAPELARLVRLYSPKHAVIELVHSMPKQGVASTFTFARAYGTILGILAALEIPTLKTAPTQWKGFFRLNGKHKDAARSLAISLYPNLSEKLARKLDHNRADALLMARYLQETRRFA
jgi:Holliday junction resolvasome RuvABC endonuclease subunit